MATNDQQLTQESKIVYPKPTLAHLRQQCGMSQMQVAQASGVRLCRVAWIESGIESAQLDILMVLSVYSHMLGQHYCIEDIDGVRVQGVL